MQAKKSKDSSVIMSQVMTPQDANLAGNVHGGVIMKLIDNAAGVVAMRHAQTNVVTASVDRMDFHFPVFIGDLVWFKASVNLVGRTSMEVGVRAEAENLKTREVRHTASAYLTLVALDDNGRPTTTPPLILETEDEIRRNREAAIRRAARLREREAKKQTS
ncbi:MAG: acyl-CoA thioesterase [Chloroflexota bacterium]|nr:acyl-CoA thioesterase [Chloroflexota bacterium]